MISDLTLPSPFHPLVRLSEAWGVELSIKRDDLIPQWLGGNKVRKAYEIIRTMVAAGGMPDVLITNGGAESNHARVIALLGAQLGCKVHLVLHGAQPGETLRGNSYFYRSAGAHVHYVRSSEIAETITSIERRERQHGNTVQVIPGGGHSIDGAKAYELAVDELPYEPDYIVHASGTGGTQAGLQAGVFNKGWCTRVIGISIARAAERGIDEIARLLPESFPRNKIDFRDEYRFGGYEKFDTDLVSFVSYLVKEEGVPFDLTYTGKAMYGLKKIVDGNEIEPGARVVFWHTGGLLNLQSARLGENDELK